MISINMKEKWMSFAIIEANKGLKIDEVPIGAIIIKNDRIIGRGFNQTENLKDPTAHAELIAITSATNSLNEWRLNDCSLYVTKEPCLMCYGAIINARISTVYYGASDLENGFVSKVNRNVILNKHLKKIESNILENECKTILLNFFKTKRKKNKKT